MSRSPEVEPHVKKTKLEQPARKRLKPMKTDDDDDFGEGEVEDTQLVKTDVTWRMEVGKDDRFAKVEEPFNFKSPHDPKLLQTFPQRTRTEIADSKIVFSSDFCSGNLARV